MSKNTYWWLFGIIILAVFFRFFLINQMPGGLFPDEAANGLDINLMEQGHLQPFYERGNGREALFFYMLWGSVKAFGRGPWQHHIVAATVGVGVVIFTFLLTRLLFQIGETEDKSRKANRIAIWASFLIAVSTWPVVISRTAFRANLLPLFSVLTFYLILVTAKADSLKKKLFWSAMSGAAFALGFYTYIAYRVMAPILLMIILWPLLVDTFRQPRFTWVKEYWKPFVAFVISFVIFVLPIALYFIHNPESFVGRSGQVSVFNPELNHGHLFGTIIEVTRVSLLGYFVQGDLNYRHNISGYPFLSPLISPFFAFGLVAAAILGIIYFFYPKKYPKYWKYFLLTGWFWGMLLPVITTAEGIPHGLRAIGTLPPAFILTAFVMEWIWEKVNWLTNRLCQYCTDWRCTLFKVGPMIVVAAFMLALPIQTYALYFIGAYNDPAEFYSFRSDLTNVSNWLLAYGDKSNTYLVLDKFSIQTTDYFTTVDGPHPDNPKNQPYIQVDPENSWQLQNLKKGDKIVFTQSSIFDIKKFMAYHPNAALTYGERNKFNQWVLAVYTIQ